MTLQQERTIRGNLVLYIEYMTRSAHQLVLTGLAALGLSCQVMGWFPYLCKQVMPVVHLLAEKRSAGDLN